MARDAGKRSARPRLATRGSALALTQVVGLRVLARGAFDAKSLKAIGTQALAHISA